MLKFFELLSQVDRTFGLHVTEGRVSLAGNVAVGIVLLDVLEGVAFRAFNDMNTVRSRRGGDRRAGKGNGMLQAS